MLTKIKKLFGIRLLYTLWINFKYRKQILGKKKIIIIGKCHFKIDKSAKIILNGNLRVGENSFGNHIETIIRMEKDSILQVNGSFQLYYGADVILFSGSKLEVGNSFINSDSKIRCHKYIKIGNDCAISHDFTIMDSNVHALNGNKGTNPIYIGDNVWIGTRVTMLNGVNVGTGAVIGANSLITKEVPEKTLVCGNPAKVIKTDVIWNK